MLSAGSSMGSAQQSEIKHELWGFPADRGSDGSSRLLTEERFTRGRSHSPANRRIQRSHVSTIWIYVTTYFINNCSIAYI